MSPHLASLPSPIDPQLSGLQIMILHGLIGNSYVDKHLKLLVLYVLLIKKLSSKCHSQILMQEELCCYVNC